MKIETNVSVLVRRRAALGDVVMSTAVVRELYKKYNGKCSIVVETEFPLVYKNNPYIVGLHNWGECNPVDYDVVINLDDSYELNPDNHFVDSMMFRAFGAGVGNLNRAPDLHADENDKITVNADLKDIGPFWAVHMRNWHWALKNIEVDIWCDIFARVFEQNAETKVMVIGGPTDYMLEHPLFIDARAKYTPQQLAYLLDHAKCFVGIDSGPFHIASASSTHVIGLLTHNPPENIMPIRRMDTGWHTTAIQADIDCVGCNVTQTRPVQGIRCKHGDFRCNKLWDTQKIADAILTQIGK